MNSPEARTSTLKQGECQDKLYMSFFSTVFSRMCIKMFNIKEILAKIAEMAEKEKSKVAELTSRLVKFDTVAPPGETQECALFIKSYMEDLGAETYIYERRSRKTNLLARLKGGRKETIIWLGHLDVVPAGSPENWFYDPFGGQVTNCRVYGRGSSDMKGSCASAMVAAKILSSLQNDDQEIKRLLPTIDFWFTCDEEVGAIDGARWLSAEGLFNGSACIIGDAFGSLPSDPWIDVGCKGYIRVKLKAKGKTAHGSMPFMGDNAIEKLIVATRKLKEISDYPLDLPEDIEYIAESSKDFLISALYLEEKKKRLVEKVFRYPTVSLNIFHGGVRVNVVPDEAEAIFDIRITPGASIWKVEDILRKLLKASKVENVQIEVTEFEDGFYEPLTSKIVKKMMETVKLALGGEPRPKILTGTTDGIHLEHKANIPCVGFGAGARGMAHAPNEYVTQENLVMAAKVYALFPLIWIKDQ